MQAIVTFIHVIISVLLVLSILMQSSKGGGLAGVMGGDSMGAAFGGRGAANFLTRATTILAVLFALSAMTQVFMSKGQHSEQSVVQQELGAPSTPASSLPGLPVNSTPAATPDTTK